jgi:hypothetical protein
MADLCFQHFSLYVKDMPTSARHDDSALYAVHIHYSHVRPSVHSTVLIGYLLTYLNNPEHWLLAGTAARVYLLYYFVINYCLAFNARSSYECHCFTSVV